MYTVGDVMSRSPFVMFVLVQKVSFAPSKACNYTLDALKSTAATAAS